MHQTLFSSFYMNSAVTHSDAIYSCRGRAEEETKQKKKQNLVRLPLYIAIKALKKPYFFSTILLKFTHLLYFSLWSDLFINKRRVHQMNAN